jgi:nicotinate dehydrogenase subunit A
MNQKYDDNASDTSREPITLRVNGRETTVDVAPETPLLYVLRNDLELNGPKFGCGLGECGACSVMVDGILARSCITPISHVRDREVTTLEGLGGPDSPDYVQTAFIAEQGAQCGYCLNGMIMTTHALLRHNPNPTEQDIRQALRYNLCRCGTHFEILASVRRAARMHPAHRHDSVTHNSGQQGSRQ